ncbi:SOS response-associated peptidase family protein [Pseudoxanthomonas mexicana]|uniref:Abasic site processing protein n=1 Tax=Pseudoxanthomonas mexicana TaxID=128785 RepID=A0A7G9T8D0_PSEMX|nr:SOS response-associated peptidase family protein [Pseudoxanthomonas mexicana]QNN76355.1 SOS response-associated peptidase family protein [Pseudoxanthomonas mexicana]
MCYSAMIQADYQKFVRHHGAIMSLEDFARNVWAAPDRARKRRRPKAMEDWLRLSDEPRAQQIWGEILRQRAERELELQEELFKQKRRLADAERALLTKTTKKAEEDRRISTDKIGKLKIDLDDLQRVEPKVRDARFFPGNYAPVIVIEDGRRVVKPMRYQCRLPGWTEAVERKYPRTYNARRDSLGKAWRELFGVRHGIIVLTSFYENVEKHNLEHRDLAAGEESQNVVLEFRPEPVHDMLVACLWNASPEGDEELLSFAVITDEPTPEIAAAGHDRAIIELSARNIDAWLTPEHRTHVELGEILDERPEVAYQHKVAAAA